MKKGLLIALCGVLLCTAMVIPGYAVDIQGTYVDVFDTDWFANDVGYVYNGKLMDGKGNTFSPTANTTRGELIEAMYRMDGSPDVAITDEFTDLSASSPYATSVSWAAENGIVNGYDNGKVGVDDKITREQMVTILYRYAEAKGMDLSNKADLSSYADANTISKWAQDAFSWANKAGLINGTSTTTLSPKGTTTRAQVAAVVHRYGEGIYGKTCTGDFVASHRDRVIEYLLAKEIRPYSTISYDYDSSGNYLGKTESLKTTGSIAICTYDANNRLVTVRRYQTLALVDRQWVDVSDNPILLETYNCLYDTRGTIIKIVGLESGFDRTYSTQYDSEGRIIFGSEPHASALYGLTFDREDITYSYSSDGYSKRTKPVAGFYYSIETYDLKNRLMSNTLYETDTGEIFSTHNYYYNDNGTLSSETECCDADHIDTTRTYYYNGRGDISEINYRGKYKGYDYDLYIKYQNTYDEHGNLISQDQTGYDPLPGLHKPCTYEYIAIERH